MVMVRGTGNWTIKQAAELLGVNARTVRRYIKTGKVKARQEFGRFGLEWRITELPTIAQPPASSEISTALLADLLSEKDRRIEELNRMLGAAQFRIGDLEKQVKLLGSPSGQHRQWWRRLFSRK